MSVGLAVIMLVVDIVMYSIITWYIDSINPGPYGKRKPLTFVFKVTGYPFNSSQRIYSLQVLISIYTLFLKIFYQVKY